MLRKIFCTLIIGAIFYIQNALAHSPIDLTLVYDHDTAKLEITVEHPIYDQDTHYIREIAIHKNNEEPIILYYPRQPRIRTFTQEVNIKATAGDSLTVKVYCSQGGSLSATLEVPEPPKDEQQ